MNLGSALQEDTLLKTPSGKQAETTRDRHAFRGVLYGTPSGCLLKPDLTHPEASTVCCEVSHQALWSVMG